MGAIAVTRTWLQMLSSDQLEPAASDDEMLRLEFARNCPPSFYRYLYSTLPTNQRWVDRLNWTDTDVRNHLRQASVSLWVLYYLGVPAGFCETIWHGDRSTEIVYLGLLPEYMGRGFGKHLLTCIVEQAWASGTSRVWFQTSSLHAPATIPNALGRGFRSYKEEVATSEVAVPAAMTAGLTIETLC